MTKHHNRKTKKMWRIICLLISAGFFTVNCVCAFYVTASLTGIYSVLDMEISNDISESDEITFNLVKSEEKAVYKKDMPASEGLEDIENTSVIENYENYIGNITGVESNDEIKIYEIDSDTIDAEIIEESEESEEADAYTYRNDWDKLEWRYKLTERELNLVAAVAMLEDSGAMEAISEVILNRVESGDFGGDTVGEVIYAKGQFYVAKYIDEKSVAASEEAVEAALAVFRDGVSVVGDAKFFAEKSVNPKKIASGLYLIDSMGSTNFYGQK